MENVLKLQVGIESFEEIRSKGFYFVDKTKLIEDLFENWGKVSLFTRPRRFGKTLNMSMLRSFFEVGRDKSLFDGTYISKNRKLFEEHMGKYPVISLTLKDVEENTFEGARGKLVDLIALEAKRFSFLLDSERLSELDKKRYQALINYDHTRFIMEPQVLDSSLKTLSLNCYIPTMKKGCNPYR